MTKKEKRKTVREEFSGLIEALKELKEEEKVEKKFGLASTVCKYDRLKDVYERRMLVYRYLPRNLLHVKVSRHDIGQPAEARLYCRGMNDGPVSFQTAHKNAFVCSLLEKFWRAVLENQGSLLPGGELPDEMTGKEYVVLYRRIVNTCREDLFPFAERWPPFTKDDIEDAIHTDYQLEVTGEGGNGEDGLGAVTEGVDTTLGKTGYTRKKYEEKILELCDVFCNDVDGVNYYEYMKRLYIKLFPKSVRGKINELETRRLQLEEDELSANYFTHNSAAHDRYKQNKKIDGWLNDFNRKMSPHATRIRRQIVKRQLANTMPKPLIHSETWAKRIGAEGWRTSDVRRKGGGGLVGRLDLRPMTSHGGGRKTPSHGLSNQYTVDKLIRRSKSHSHMMNVGRGGGGKVTAAHVNRGKIMRRPSGLGTHAVIFNSKSMRRYVKHMHKTTLRGPRPMSSPYHVSSNQQDPQRLHRRSTKQGDEVESYSADVQDILDSYGPSFRGKTPVQIFFPVSNSLTPETSNQIHPGESVLFSS